MSFIFKYTGHKSISPKGGAPFRLAHEKSTEAKKYYNSSSEIKITGDFRIGDIAHNKADISAARELLQFEPKVSLQEGLSSFCQWVMGQGEKSGNYQQSLSEMEKAGMFIRKQSDEAKEG